MRVNKKVIFLGGRAGRQKPKATSQGTLLREEEKGGNDENDRMQNVCWIVRFVSDFFSGYLSMD